MSKLSSAVQYGLISKEDFLSTSGIDILRGMKDGTFPLPPMSQALGFSVVEIEDGLVVFSSEPKYDFYNPMGTVHGGYIATLLDTCMACSVQTRLKPGENLTTLEFKINCVRPITTETGLVYAEGRLITAGRNIATAEGRLKDKHGKVYAFGTTTCSIFSVE